MIVYTRHALNKFKILQRHGVFISKKDVQKAIDNPDLIDHSRNPLIIAQCQFDESHVLRVVFKKENGAEKVITFYPGRKKSYEKKR